MDVSRKSTLAMHTLLLCADVQFLGTTRAVLNQLQVNPKIAGGCDEALAMIQNQEFEVIIVDWREIDNLAEFLGAVRRSKLNQECVLVAIVRDLLDLRQAFAAGVHFLVHKPASVVQIERCLRAAYCATVARRRKQHREPVNVLVAVRTRTQTFAEATILNLSEGGVGLRTSPDNEITGVHLSAGEEVDLRFPLPDSADIVHATGTVVWITASHC
jgi:response regulator RpfG family c-di-GMP phosphodiesterase